VNVKATETKIGLRSHDGADHDDHDDDDDDDADHDDDDDDNDDDDDDDDDDWPPLASSPREKGTGS